MAIDALERRTGFSASFAAHNDTVCNTIASFSFTMLGFMATVITIFLALYDRPFLKEYRHFRHFGNFLFFYFLTMFCLLIAIVIAFFTIAYKSWLDILFASTLLCLLQILLIGVITYVVVHKTSTC
jgi:hypothetical protein